MTDWKPTVGGKALYDRRIVDVLVYDTVTDCYWLRDKDGSNWTTSACYLSPVKRTNEEIADYIMAGRGVSGTVIRNTILAALEEAQS